MAHDDRLLFQRRHLPDGVGATLRTARVEASMTRREVACAVGIAPRTLARIERGEQKPLWPTLDRLCDHLGVSASAVARRWVVDSFDVPTDPRLAPGLIVRELRRRRGLTLQELATATGVSVATLSRFERGLTASRLLARRVGPSDMPREEHDVVLGSDRLARALGLANVVALAQLASDPTPEEEKA